MWTILIQKLHHMEDETSIFYMRTCITDADGEYGCWRKILEITEEEFLQYKTQSEELEEPEEIDE